MKYQFNIVTGVMRSGTSAMMRALYYSRILIAGYKYPVLGQDKQGKPIECGSNVPLELETQESNPTGFWEMPLVTRDGLKKTSSYANWDGNTVKVVMPAIMNSDRELIGKAIVMIRNPKTCLSSMIKGWKERDMQHDKDILPLDYILTNLMGLKYLKENQIPFIIVIYEKLIENPSSVLSRVAEFLGEGDYTEGAKAIEKRLNRSKEVDFDVSEAEEFYDKCVERDLEYIFSLDPMDYKKRIDEIYLKKQKEANK